MIYLDVTLGGHVAARSFAHPTAHSLILVKRRRVGKGASSDVPTIHPSTSSNYLEAITSLYSENTALLTPAFLVEISAELELIKQSKVFQNARQPLFAKTNNTLNHSTSPNDVGQSYS